ncbi:MAG TPA: hypothetical protein VLU25_11465 [Acidobacteriota bacterium]|nr:hypothetical protein [Acidobacteriota bacterium]
MIVIIVFLLMQVSSKMPESRLTIPDSHVTEDLLLSPDSSLLSVYRGGESALWDVKENAEIAKFRGLGLDFLSTEELVVLTREGAGERVDVLTGEEWNRVVSSYELPTSSEADVMTLAVDRESDHLVMALRVGPRFEILALTFRGQSRRYEIELGCKDVSRMAVRWNEDQSASIAVACRSVPVVEIFTLSGPAPNAQLTRAFRLYLEDVDDPGPAGYTKGELMITEDCQYLVSSHFDKRLRVWRLDDGTRLGELVSALGRVVLDLLEVATHNLVLELTAAGRQRILNFRSLPSFEVIARLSGDFATPGAMALSQAETLGIAGFCHGKEMLPLPDGTLVERPTRSPCLRIYSWPEVLQAADLPPSAGSKSSR